MNSNLTEFEKKVLKAVFNHKTPEFLTYTNQIDGLKVESRENEGNGYSVVFCGTTDRNVEGIYGNIDIHDTYINFDELGSLARVTALGGNIKYLGLTVPETFKLKHLIKNISWVVAIKNKKFIFTDDENERNLDRAIGFIPTYK